MNNKPPKYAEQLLRIFLPKREREFLIGDYEYLFQEVFERWGKNIAHVWYWMFVLKSIPTFLYHKFYWGIVMFRSYLKLALRNLNKRKGYSFINLFGLATGIACAILTLGYVQDELSYDRFNENVDNVYVATFDNGSTTTPTALSEYLKSEYPQVIATTRFTEVGRSYLKTGTVEAFQSGGVIVDPDFLKMFSIDLLSGNVGTALSNPHSAIISESVAKKYFGETNPIGKTITYENRYGFTVSGIFKDYPDNSHIKCTFIIPNAIFTELGRDMTTWEFNSIRTYVRLNSNASLNELNKSISDVVEKHRPVDKRELFLQPITKLRLDPYNNPGTITYVYIFSILAFLILIIACINFINLTTAKSSIRSKEVGVRKTLGAYRIQLIGQFFSESFLLTFFSLLLALILVWFMLPYFNNLASKNFTISFLLNPYMIIGIAVVLIITGILAGIYPAFYISKLNVTRVIKGGAIAKGKVLFRKVSVVIQFTASVFLILFASIVFSQVKYMEGKDVGYDKNNIIYFEIGQEFIQNINTIKSKLLENPKVMSVSLMNLPPYGWNTNAGFGDVSWEGKTTEQVKMVMSSIDYDYLKIFNLKIAQGRFFSKEFSTDQNETYVINEAAAKAMNLDNPVGKQLKIWDDERKIIGVVKDYNFESLHSEIIPMAMMINPGWYNYACVKISSNNIASTLGFIESKWEEIYSGYPFEYNFLDETLRSQYETEEAMGNGITFLMIIALLISCMGLFALSSYAAEQKTKEIGIRKVLGASVLSIVQNIAKEFFVLVMWANIIAFPLTYYLAKNWLRDFPYRIEISVWLFIYTFVAMVGITLITIIWHIISAARQNPVNSLKYE